MAEKIEVFKLDIDVDAAIQATSDLKKKSDQLKAGLKQLKDQGDTNSREYVEMEAAYKNLNKQYRDGRKEISNLLSINSKNIKTVEEARSALKVVNKEWAKNAKVYGEDSKAAKKLSKKKLELTDRLKEVESATGDNTRNVGNYKDSVKGAIQETGLFGGKLGQLQGVAQSFSPVITKVKSDIQDATSSMRSNKEATKGMSKAQKAAAVSTNLTTGALKLFKIALAATGIGLIVVALGSLVAYLTSTQAGINKVNKVLTPLKVIFQSLLGLIQDFGEQIFNAFTNPKQAIKDLWEVIETQIVNRVKGVGEIFKSLGKIISSGFTDGYGDLGEAVSKTTTGVENLNEKIKKSAKDFKGFVDEAVKRGSEIENIRQNLSKTEADFITKQADLKAEFRQQKLLSDDTTKSQEERISAGERALEIQKEISENSIERTKQEAKILRLQNKSNDTTDEDRAKLAKKEAEIAKAKEEQASKSTEAQNKLNSIRKKAQKERIAAAKKATDQAIAESKTRLDIYIQENQARTKGLKENLAFQEKIRDKKLSILQAERDAGKKTQSEYELEKLKIKNEFLDKQKELTIENSQEELEVFKDKNQSRIDENKLLTDAIVSEEQRRLDLIAQKEREYQEERLEKGLISEQEYNAAINQINEENRQAKAEKQEQLDEQKAEAKAIDLENQRALDQQRLQYDFELQTQYLNREKQKEIEKARATGASVAKIEEKYAQQKKQIEQTLQENKTQLASETFGNLVTILGKETKAGKAAAVAKTTIDTYQSATAAYKSLAGIPVVGPALGAAAAAAAVVSGLKNVQKITSTKKPKIPKAEKGALFKIGGKPHSQGGTRFQGEDGTEFEAEKDELIGVMNRRAAKAFSTFNDEYQGGSTVDRANYMAGGGFVNTKSITAPTQSQSAGSVDYDQLAKGIGTAVADANKNLPRPVTDVKDVVGQVNQYNSVVDGANI